MKLGETDPTLLRIGPIRVADSNGDPVLGEDFSGPGEAEINVNDGPFGAIAGTIEEIGASYYYLQAVPADAATRGFVDIKLSGPCDEVTLREEVEEEPQGIPVGSTDPDDLHVNLRLVDSNGVALVSTAGVVLEITINGSTWAAASGALSLTDPGYGDYVPVAGDVAAAGWFAIKATGACQEFTIRTAVVQPRDVAAPLVTVVSPTPGVAAGAPGGFPANYRTAKDTPIVLQVADLDPGLIYFVLIARFYVGDTEEEDPAEEVVYRRGVFRGPYKAGSFTRSTSGGLQLSVRRTGGWPSNLSRTRIARIAFALDAIDGNGNLSA